MKNYLVFGAYSAIAEATARKMMVPDAGYFLVGRDAARLQSVGDDLKLRGAGRVLTREADLAQIVVLDGLVNEAFETLGRIDAVLLAHGTLPDQSRCVASAGETKDAFRINALSHICLLTAVANRLEVQGAGTIVAITSVAGDRGRRSNYVYGAAKRAVSSFLEGLRHRLEPRGIRVVDIRPGFVDTPMTEAFDKGLLWASPEQVARGIVRAMKSGKRVAYVPGFWWLIMLIIRNLPNFLFKRLNI